MAVESFYTVFLQLSGFLWPLLNFGLVFAAVLLFKAERRAHTLCLIIGFAILALTGVWARLYPMMLARSSTAPEDYTRFYAFQSAIGLIGEGLVLYGLLSFALIHYRRSKLPRFEEEERNH